MAATKLIAMHQNKGRSVMQCLKDRTDYAMNGDKTEDGNISHLISVIPSWLIWNLLRRKKNICTKHGGSLREMCLHIRSASLSSLEKLHRRKQMK